MAKMTKTAKDPIKAAEEAGLFYTSSTEAGFIRKARGKSFIVLFGLIISKIHTIN